MVKYYYDDPLQAAYMLREFNFKIGCYDIDDLNYFEEDSLNSLSDGIGNNQIESDIDSAYIIHPDCYELLKPKEGDLGKDSGNPLYYYLFWEGVWRSLNGIKLEDNGTIEIIQRNNKAFFTPKIEE